MTLLHPLPLRRPLLSDEQRRASESIDEFVDGANDRLLIGGAAGTGKTYLLEHVARRHKNAILAAPTNLIARKLGKATGRPASTLHKLLYHPLEVIDETDGETKRRLEWLDNSQLLNGSLVFIDEASLVPDWIGADLLNRGARVVAFGDHHQLPSVKAEPFFTEPDIVLTTIYRQAADSGIIRQAHRILRGLPYTSDREFQVVDRCGPNLEWADAIIVWRYATRLNVNSQMRALCGIDPHAPPRCGEPLICTFTDHRNGIVNGELFDVAEDHQQGRPLLLNGAQGVVEVAKFHIADITERQPARSETQFAFGYCLTAHKAQGLEWPNVLIFDEGMRQPLRCPWLYTATTRGSEQVKIGKAL